MVAGCGNRPENGMAHVDGENRSGLAAENIKVGDVQADILTCDGRIEMVRHGSLLEVESITPSMSGLENSIYNFCGDRPSGAVADQCTDEMVQEASICGRSAGLLLLRLLF